MRPLRSDIEKKISKKERFIRERTTKRFEKIEISINKSKILGDDGDNLFKATHEKTGLSSFGITTGEARKNLEDLLIEESLSGVEID